MATKPPVKRKRRNAGQTQKLLDRIGIEALCAEIRAGKTKRALCAELTVAVNSLDQWLAANKEREAPWRAARRESAQAWDELAGEVIQAARNDFQLRKARELGHHYRWRARMINPIEYGDKIEVEQRTTVSDLSEKQIDTRLEALIERARKANEPPPLSGAG
jgi:hypothetical protein